MKITIEKKDTAKNWWEVDMDGKKFDGLTWDEMLGLVAYSTCPKHDDGQTLFAPSEIKQA